LSINPTRSSGCVQDRQALRFQSPWRSKSAPHSRPRPDREFFRASSAITTRDGSYVALCASINRPQQAHHPRILALGRPWRGTARAPSRSPSSRPIAPVQQPTPRILCRVTGRARRPAWRGRKRKIAVPDRGATLRDGNAGRGMTPLTRPVLPGPPGRAPQSLRIGPKHHRRSTKAERPAPDGTVSPRASRSMTARVSSLLSAPAAPAARARSTQKLELS